MSDDVIDTRAEFKAAREAAAPRRPLFTLTFWADAAERAVTTFAEVALGFLIVGGGFADIDWVQVASVGGVAAVASILKSVIAAKTGTGSASIIPTV